MNKKHLILLHGWGGDGKSMALIADGLRKSGCENIHILEMPGHGQTVEMAEPWGMEEFGLWLKKYIDTNSIHEYILIGHSFGGKLILETTISGLLTPEKIVLISASGIKPKNSLKKVIFSTLSKILKPISKLILRGKLRYYFYRYVVGEVDYALTSNNLKLSFQKFIDQHYNNKLVEINVPTLILWGSNDKVTPLWMGQKMNQLIKNSKIEVVEGTHGIQKQKAEELSKHIISFIQND